MKKSGLDIILVLASFIFFISSASAWTLSGIVYDDNGNALNNTNITISSMYAPGGVQPAFYSENTTQSNVSGIFNLTVTSNSSRNYLVTLKHFNATTNKVDYVGQALPYLPNQVFSSNLNLEFYLKPAGTINITAINSTGERINFNYQIKDSQLGYTVDNNWNAVGNGALEAIAYVPIDRNYSVMLYPRSGGMPMSYSWTSFSRLDSFYLNGISNSNYNGTTKVLTKEFNTTISMNRITGYISGTSLGISGWDNFTVVPMIMESEKFLFLQHSAMPFNMSSWSGGTDTYNYSSGFFNITLPGPAESQTVLLYVSALNGSTYYGSYLNISLIYGGWGSGTGRYNFTMCGLLGSSMRNISMGSGIGSTNILTKMMSLNLVNVTDNQTLVNTGIETHVEVILDYSSISVSEIHVTDSVSGTGSAIFYLPMLNISGSKEINVFSDSFAPRRVDKKTAAQLLANNNITLGIFNPRTIDGNKTGAFIDMIMFKSNSTCDVPNPSFASCVVGNPAGNMATFNPMSAIMGGGKLSFRMSYGNISVHYVNVDMLASGPPDASFDSNITDRISSSFQAAMKFGSSGPKIYDYILVSIPYDETILKELQPVNISIPLLYDEDWNVIWNVTANGTNLTNLSSNYPHYAGKEIAWSNLTTPKTCITGNITSSNLLNETNPCYIDTASNKIWIRIPHFSGIEPQILGDSYPVTTTTTSSGGGGGGLFSSTADYTISLATLGTIVAKDLRVNDRVKFTIKNENHSLTVKSFSKDNVTVTVASTPQEVTVKVNETQKVDVDGDEIYDLAIKYSGVLNNIFAKIEVMAISEAAPSTTVDNGTPSTTSGTSPTPSTPTTSGTSPTPSTPSNRIWLIVGIILVVIIAIIVVVIKNRRKRKY